MTSNVDAVFWEGLFSQAKTEGPGLGVLEFADGSAYPMRKDVPLGHAVAGDGEQLLWPVDPLPNDRWHRARPGDVAWWEAQGAEVEFVRWHEQGRVFRALLVRSARVSPFSFARENRYPLLRIRDGEVERHFMEGGFEVQGWLVLPRGLFERGWSKAEQLRARIGHGWTRVRFADVEDAFLASIECDAQEVDCRVSYRVSIQALAEGREHTFELVWTGQEADPRRWLRRALAEIAFRPGSVEWWG